ncbi:alanine racemase [Olegusella massiliensis]|uniref:alanine racemase n=1 Tax=Olegusella massiliensis TaxID=1776381 RepID=UPI0040553EA0
MFLDRLVATNPTLADLALSLEADGTILPDTYVIDLDMVARNASLIKDAADASGISLYFMLKQLGRNPVVSRRLAELGFAGAVCVDFREALLMAGAGVPLGNVGHLVQTPHAALGRILAAHPDIMTVYSVEKAAEIGAEAERQGFVQPIMLRVLGPADTLYSGQYGGFELAELGRVVDELERIGGARVAGVCSFPCLFFSDETGELEPLPNAQTVREAAALLEARGYEGLQLNMPSASCVHSVPVVAGLGGTHMEPGHGLSGTTPYHAAHPGEPEGVAYAYVSEVSHNLGERSYCYGGGHYRRGHLQGALVGRNVESAVRVGVTPPTDESIDYHFELSQLLQVSEPVLMCFRTQLFVTRSEVAVVSGLSEGRPRLEGIFDTRGHQLR